MIDWKQGPPISTITKIQVPPINEYILDNGIKVFEINLGTQDILKIEFMYSGGRISETKKLASKFAFALLREGIPSHTSAELAEIMDYYGATLRTGSNLDYSYITLSFLSKYTDELLPILQEINEAPLFPESEYIKYQQNSLNKLNLDLAKNELLSYRIFTEYLYGKDHPYGYNTEAADILALNRDDVVKYYHETQGVQNSFIVVSGKIDKQLARKFNQYFGQRKTDVLLPLYNQPKDEVLPDRVYYQSKNEFQCAIKLGRRLFNRHHEDYTKFFVFNTIFGGYFGSRLMSTIREEHGYTYNIYSVVDHLIHDGYFYIDTELDPQYLTATEDEIYNQIHLLQTEEVDEEEMSMVRNYLMGNFLNLVDGPFNVASLIRSLEMDNIGLSDFYTFIDEVQQVNSKDIMEMANKYIHKSDMLEVIVGP